MASINFWPVLVAAIVAFGIGALWYSQILFGKEWMALIKMSDEDIADARARGVWKLYVIQFVFSLVTFCVLAFIMAATGSVSAGDGAFFGFLVWLGFVVPVWVSMLSWEKRPMKLVLINALCTLVTLVVGGAVIGAWH